MRKELRAVLALVLALMVGFGVWYLTEQTDAFRAMHQRLAAEEPDLEREFLVDDASLAIRQICFAALCGLCALALCWCLTAKEIKLHWAGFWMLVCCGGAIIAGSPPEVSFCWDDAIHWQHVEVLAKDPILRTSDFAATFTTWHFGYWPNALGVAVANLLGLVRFEIMAGRISSVLVYAALGALAIGITPKYKLTFLTLCCMPVCLFLAANYTYDATLFICLMVAVAMLVREMCRPDELITSNRMLVMTAFFCLGALPKPAYSPLLLLLLMLPKRKFGSKARLWTARGMILALTIGSVATMLLMPGNYGDIVAGDSRFSGTDSSAQLQFILSDPLHFLNVLSSFFVRNQRHLFTGTLTSFAYMGTGSQTMVDALTLLLLLAAPLYSVKEADLRPLTARRRIALAVMALIPLLGLMVAQYLVSTEVGSGDIAGMQSRYALPILILIALALMLPESLRRKVCKGSRAVAIALCCVMTLTVMWLAWSLAVEPLASGALLLV